MTKIRKSQETNVSAYLECLECRQTATVQAHNILSWAIEHQKVHESIDAQGVPSELENLIGRSAVNKGDALVVNYGAEVFIIDAKYADGFAIVDVVQRGVFNKRGWVRLQDIDFRGSIFSLSEVH